MSKANIGYERLAKLRQVAPGLVIGRVGGNKVLVEPVMPYSRIDDLENNGILYAPDEAKQATDQKVCTGIVLQVGEAVHNNFGWSHIVPGVMVYFSVIAGHSFRVEGKNWLVMNAEEIVCTLEHVDGLEENIQPVTDAIFPVLLPQI